MTIKRRDFQKAAAMIHEFQLKLSEDSECAELRDALNLALLHMQKYYRTLRNRVQKLENDRTSNGNGVLGASFRGLSPMTPFKDAPDKFQWNWINLDTVKLSGTLPADVKDMGVLPKVIQAAKIGDNNRLMQFIDKDADVIHELDGLGRNALMYAVHFGHLDTIQILLEQGIDINYAAHDGSTAVHRACHDGHHEALQILIEYEAALSVQDTQGRAPIHWACAAKDRGCLRLLLNNHCSVRVRDKEGMTPSMWACRMDNIEHFELLTAVDHGDSDEDDGYERDLSGKTWMHWSVRRTEPLECLKTLLTVDSARLRDEEGKTVIHCAAEQGSLPSVKVVLEIAGNSVMEDRDDHNRTALVLATMGGHGEIVNFLLSEGADLSCVDNNGATAWDYARGRQLHYCMLIIASYIRQRAKDRGEEVDMGTLANMTFAGVHMTGTLVNGTYNQHEVNGTYNQHEETDEDGGVDQQMNGLQINGDGVYDSGQPQAAPRQPKEPVTPRTPRAPVTPRTARRNQAPVTPRAGLARTRGIQNGAEPTTPRAPITPRAPPASRGGGDDGFSTARSQKRAPTGPVESSTEDEMVFEKHVRSGSGGKRSRKNGLQRQQSDMRVVSVMSMASTEHGQHEYIDNEEDYTYNENEVPPQSEYAAGEQEEDDAEDSVSIGAMDVSEVDQDAEDEDEDYDETEHRYRPQQPSSTLARQSSYHHIPSQAYHHQGQNTNQRQGNYHPKPQQKAQVPQSQYGNNAPQQRRLPGQQQTAGNRFANANSGGYHQPRPPPRHPPYPAHALKPPPRPQAELQDVEAEEYDEEGVGYEMPNVEAEDEEESPVSQMSPPAPARAKQLPPQQPLSSGSRPNSGDVRGQTPPAYLEPIGAPPSPTKKKKKKKKKQQEELPPPQAHGWGARPPGPAPPSTHAAQPPPLQGPVPTPRDVNRQQPQHHNPHPQGLKPPMLKPQGKKMAPSKQLNELEERALGFSLPPTPYTLDQQVKPTPPFPVHPHPAKQGKVSAVNHPPPSPRAPPIHPPSQARPRLQRMDAADPHSNDYDNRGRVQDESEGSTAPTRQGIAPITPRGGSASRQRYPPPLQNGPAQGGNQERGPPKQSGGGMFPQAGPAQNRHPPSPRGGRRGNQDLSSGLVPPIGQHKIPNGKLPSYGKS